MILEKWVIKLLSRLSGIKIYTSSKPRNKIMKSILGKNKWKENLKSLGLTQDFWDVIKV